MMSSLLREGKNYASDYFDISRLLISLFYFQNLRSNHVKYCLQSKHIKEPEKEN